MSQLSPGKVERESYLRLFFSVKHRVTDNRACDCKAIRTHNTEESLLSIVTFLESLSDERNAVMVRLSFELIKNID